MRSKPILFVTSVLTVLVLGMFESSAFAQNEGEAKPQTAVQTSSSQKISVEFKGGKVKEYIEALKAARSGVNIVVDPEANEVELPSISLKDVILSEALEVVAKISKSSRPLTISQSQNSYVIVPERFSSNGTVFNGTIDQVQKLTSIFTVSHLLQGGNPSTLNLKNNSLYKIKAETLLTAIDAAFEVQGTKRTSSPVIKYHAESGLLIVHGTEPQLKVIRDLLSQLAQSQSNANNAIIRNELESQVNELKSQIEEMKSQLQELNKTLKK